MKLFIVGPVQMYPEVLQIRKTDFPYFRTEQFSGIMKDNAEGLSELLGNHSSSNIVFFTMSGTGAMEAVVENCLYPEDRALVINGGTFGRRFCDLLAFHKKDYSSVDLKWNECLTEAHLLPFENKNYTALFVNLHETSTGQLYDIKMLSAFAKRNGMMLIVDAISAFLADDFNMDSYGIDAVIISSQKGLCCSAGMSCVSVSDRMKEKILSGKCETSYFCFRDYFVNMERGQTPYTPAVGVAWEIHKMLELINRTGKEKWLAHTAEKTHYFRRKAKELGLVVPETYTLSNMLTPLYFQDTDASEIIRLLREKYELYVNPCGGALAHSLFRVSHIGNTEISDFDELLERIISVKEEIKR